MRITRDGKDYELTMNELNLAYNEMRRITWRQCIEDAIDRNMDNLRFDDDFSRAELVEDCMDRMEDWFYDEDFDDRFDEILFDTAEWEGIWTDGDDDDEEEDEDDE